MVEGHAADDLAIRGKIALLSHDRLHPASASETIELVHNVGAHAKDTEWDVSVRRCKLDEE